MQEVEESGGRKARAERESTRHGPRMRGVAAFSPSKRWQLTSHSNPITDPTTNTYLIQFVKTPSTRRVNLLPSFAVNPSKIPTPIPKDPIAPPLVVVGSANADIYVEIDRLPGEGETISAKTGQTLAGGKGANQAVCGGKLSYPTYFVGQVRNLVVGVVGQIRFLRELLISK